jgi:ribonuclease HI
MTNFDDYDIVYAHTDGACAGNPGPGGWGAIFTYGDKELERICGRDPDTTNNRMELIAAIESFKVLENTPDCEVMLLSDSKYVIDGWNKWLPKWKANSWRTSTKTPVKNVELWRELDALIAPRTSPVSFVWVRGHAGHNWNEEADRLAKGAIGISERPMRAAQSRANDVMAPVCIQLESARLHWLGQCNRFSELAGVCSEVSLDQAQAERLNAIIAKHATEAAETHRAIEAALSAVRMH